MNRKKLNKKVGFWGCGNMGSAILRGALNAKIVSPYHINIFEKKKITQFKQCKIFTELNVFIKESDILILGFKPQDLSDIAAHIDKASFKGKCIVSLLAGTPLSKLEKSFGSSSRIIRTMPNLGAMVSSGATALCKNRKATLRDLADVELLFSSSGITVTVPENKMDVVTAISGSGPAYFFYLTELLIAAGLRHGLKRSDVSKLACATSLGAATLQNHFSFTPEEWRSKVTSPGGTTEAAFKRLLKASFQKSFHSAIDDAIHRASDLSKM